MTGGAVELDRQIRTRTNAHRTIELSPESWIANGQTHFEQIYDRANKMYGTDYEPDISSGGDSK